MTSDQLKALFLLSGIEMLNQYEIRNKYWPDSETYDGVRTPWWLVKTEFGMIEIGWRKRVISIDWSDTGIAAIVTKDEVTKNDHSVHAWNYADAVKYLTTLCFLLPVNKRKQEEQKEAAAKENA